MRKIFTINVLLCLICWCIFSESIYVQKYKRILDTNNRSDLLPLITEWEINEPNSIELKTAQYNYYVLLDSKSESTMGQMDNGQYGFYSKVIYNEKNVLKAIDCLNEGIKINPDRLDIHFAKCTSYLKIYLFNEASEAIINVFNQSIMNSNKWLWSYDQRFEDNNWSGEGVLFNALEDYLSIMYNYHEKSKKYTKKITDLAITLYPNNVYGLNLAARYYILEKDYINAEKLLLRAYEIDSQDYIVIINLATLYENINDKTNALKYYNVLLSIDSNEAKKFGEEGIIRIENQEK